jgi:hypothetical protein
LEEYIVAFPSAVFMKVMIAAVDFWCVVLVTTAPYELFNRRADLADYSNVRPCHSCGGR